MAAPRARWWVAGAGAAGFATLAVFWPGVAMYDSVAQYRQALSGRYDDWHPPAMARLWSLFGAAGGAPMLGIQIALYWLGLGLLAGAIARSGRRGAAVAVVAIGLWPPLLGWQAVILKDTQMLGALLAAIGLVAWWRLRARPLPGAAIAGVAMLVGYATLVRANAVFATVPLAVMLFDRPRSVAGKAVMMLGAVALVLVLAPVANHRLLGADRSGVERTQALYDLAGIAARTGDAAIGLSPAAIAELRARRCVSAFFWNPLGAPGHCDATMAPLRALPVPTLYATWAAAALRHPLAYAAHRLLHVNSTARWLVPWRWPDAAPPAISEPNDLALASPGRSAAGWQTVAAWLVETPIGWPACWVIVAITALAARPRGTAAARLARALLVSALAMEGSFAALSIASDLRYHLWPMTATALAVVLAGGARWDRRVAAIGAVLLAVAIAGGLVARARLPLPPATYAGMLG